MNHIGLFEGIGGFSLAASWVGWKTVAWCEWNEFGQKVLKYHFPEAEGFDDITKTDFTKYANKIDIITGGFPCQPYSHAGKRLGKDDERHLWPEMLRAIREIKPSYVVAENVLGLVNWNDGLVFHEVQVDLENEGYEVQPYILPAASQNAPHKRDRVWFVAYSHNNRTIRRTRQNESESQKERVQKRNAVQQSVKPSSVWKFSADTNGNRLERCIPTNKHRQFSAKEKYDEKRIPTYKAGLQFQNFPTQPPLCGGDDGLPTQLDGITFSKWRNESIKAYGNAIVPQVALQIFKTIDQYEIQTNSNTG